MIKYVLFPSQNSRWQRHLGVLHVSQSMLNISHCDVFPLDACFCRISASNVFIISEPKGKWLEMTGSKFQIIALRTNGKRLKLYFDTLVFKVRTQNECDKITQEELYIYYWIQMPSFIIAHVKCNFFVIACLSEKCSVIRSGWCWWKKKCMWADLFTAVKCDHIWPEEGIAAFDHFDYIFLFFYILCRK